MVTIRSTVWTDGNLNYIKQTKQLPNFRELIQGELICGFTIVNVVNCREENLEILPRRKPNNKSQNRK